MRSSSCPANTTSIFRWAFTPKSSGLGASPDAVHIIGNVHADASLPHNNATCTFWRAVEGFSVTPTGGTMQWAVSQAVPFRRMHVLGDIVLHQNHGWASGGWMSDSLIDGNVDSGPQQQWISRNSEWGSWTGSNWNMVFVGVVHPPDGEWPTPPYTKIAETPIVREKPFLLVDAHGNWSVRVPSLRTNSVGITWRGGSYAGTLHSALASSTSPIPAPTPPRPSTRNWRRASTCCSRPASTNSANPSA